MQLHELKPTIKGKHRKRIGRGGKRGTYSGRGSKGQKSRAGHRIRPGFRGGDNPIWKLFPKQRGASKKTEIKHALFRVRQDKPAIVSINDINEFYKDGEKVSPNTLMKKGLIRSGKKGVKILGNGGLKRKLTFEKVKFSKNVSESIQSVSGVIK